MLNITLQVGQGWKADVPIYKLNTSKIRDLGWKNKLNSLEAVEDAIESMLIDVKKGNIKSSAI